MDSQKNFDYIADVMDEITLEGLDGITLNSLWVRLEKRKGFCLCLDSNSKEFLWKAINVNPELEFYELPEPRPPLILFNRYDHRDNETGMCLEVLQENAPNDIYPIKIVDEKLTEYRGSCLTFNTRKSITKLIRDQDAKTMSYGEVVQKYDETMVIVASQKLRSRLLFGESSDPQLEISSMQYTMLELIARAREHGIITTGRVCSFVDLNESPKSLFYHRKLLIKKQLIKRQLHFQRNKNTTQWGFVFHHPRFYVERPTAVNLMLKRLCSILEQKPLQTEQFATLRSEAGIPETTFKKILARGQPLSQFTEVSVVRYRELYPDATDAEAFSVKKTERQLKIVKLVKPFAWNSLLEEGEADDDDEDGDIDMGSDKITGCDVSRLMMVRPIVCQAYDLLYKHSPEGMSEREIQKALGITRLDARSICRYLTRASVVSTYMKDKGRQRMTMYVIAEHLHMSQAHQNILAQRQRIIQSDSFEDRSVLNMELDPTRSVPVTLTNRIIRQKDTNQELPSLNKEASSVDSKFLPTPLAGSSSNKKSDSDTRFNFYDKNLTAKQLSRANFILETVRKQIFIDDIYKIQRALSEKEVKEGCQTRLDKRSVMTLVQKLAHDGHIKSIKTVLKLGDNVKKLHFVCLPDITESSVQVQSAIQNAKFRLVGLKYTDTKKIYESVKKPSRKRHRVLSTDDGLMDDEEGGSSSQDTSPSSFKHEWKNKIAEMKFQTNMGKMYGLLPKFCRANILHELLFYLVHDYQGIETEAMPATSTEELMIIEDDSVEFRPPTQPTVYSEKKDWKMFISPLPVTDGYPSGWCLVSDVLQRLPVSVFLQIVNIPFRIEGFNEFIDNPIKKHYLISQLPIKIRNSLLMSRRYIFHINDILLKLCYMGLITFGPQIHKDKDQIYIYVHRITGVMDTTVSDPGHFTISEGQDYSWRFHLLNCMMDVHNYWLDLKTVCLNTPLGRKSNDRESITIKPELTESAECRSIEDVVDDGRVPGDHRGAGGLDSSLCSYLKRNWAASQAIDRSLNTQFKRKVLKEKEKPSSLPLPKLLKQGISMTDMKKRLNRLPKQVDLTTTQPENAEAPDKRLPVSVSIEKNYHGPKNAPKVSIIRPKSINKKKPTVTVKKHKKKDTCIDPKDLAALALMQTQRATWTAQEDTFLLLCKVASALMGLRQRLAVSSHILRDEHDKYCSKSYPKTSKACRRRYNLLMKVKKMYDVAAIMIQETERNEVLSSLASLPTAALGTASCDKKFQLILKELISIYTVKKINPTMCLPETWDELNEKYVVSVSSNEPTSLNSHYNPKNMVDIYCNIVYTIVLVTVSSFEFHTNWSYHLYKLFQQYPDNLLRAVYTRMRKDKTISLPKTGNFKKYENYVNSSHPYRISISFKNSLLTRFQSEIFDVGSRIYCNLMDAAKTANPFVTMAPNSYEGAGVVMQALMATRMIVLRTEVPEQIIDVLDDDEPIGKKRKFVEKFVSQEVERTNVSTQLTENSESSEVRFSLKQKDSTQTLPASRLGLHLMRKQIFTTPVFKNVRHAGDYFVMNSCDVLCRMRSNVTQVVPPLNENFVQRWMKPFTIDVEQNISIQQYCSKIDITGADKKNSISIYNAIKESKVLGISQEDLLEAVQMLSITGAQLLNILKQMCQHSLIVRVGVQSYLYVTIGHAVPWLMRTLIIPKDKKSIAGKASGSVTSFAAVTVSTSQNVIVDDNADVIRLPDNDESKDNDVSIIDEFGSAASTSAETRKKRKRIKKVFASNTDQSLSESDCVKVDLIGRPWHKPDGFVNKKSLFRFLESVSTYITLNPGISENDLFKHYSPFLQPVYILDLLEMLEQSSCVTKMFLKSETVKAGPFFSRSYDIKTDDGIHKGYETFYEPQVDILLKVAQIKRILNVTE